MTIDTSKNTNTSPLGKYFYFSVALVYLIAIVLTDGHYWGDSADYVDSVISYEQGDYYHFWDFGHLFWRPLGWAIWSIFVDQTNEELLRMGITSAFQTLVHGAGLISVILFTRIVEIFNLRKTAAIVAVVGFILAHAFLNYSQTANSYIPGLMCYLAGLVLAVGQGSHKSLLRPFLSGIFLAFSFCFWIAFMWVLPAAFLAALVLYGLDRVQLKNLFVSVGAFSITLGVCYGITLVILGIYDVQSLLNWITNAAHQDETRGVMRVFFGTARSFVYMGNDGMLFKRFLLGDPLNPVSIADLLRSSLVTFAAFYGTVALVAWTLFRNPDNRRFLVLLAISVLPIFLFATQHGGGEIEWHLAHFPFSFAALGLAIQNPVHRAVKYIIVGVVLLFSLINFTAMTIWRMDSIKTHHLARIESLMTAAQKTDTFFLINWQDDLMNFNRAFPYEPLNARGDYRFNVVVTPGTGQTKQWKEEFAVRSIHAWDTGNSVWLSNRGFAEIPKSDWNWTEGDDQNVRWHEFPGFFNELDIGERLGDENGFSLILPSEKNREFLQPYKEKYQGKIHFDTKVKNEN